MRLIGGADGCRGGWILAAKNLHSGQISCQRCTSTLDLLLHKSASLEILALDIPIGLADKGPRQCDLQARRLLKTGRASSVFPAPIRPVLSAKEYRHACLRRFEIESKHISVQAWAIAGRIREVDALLRADPQIRNKVHETHPEVCFYFLSGGRPCRYGKKNQLGQAERRNLLMPFFNGALDSALVQRRELGCAPDDILDAFAALWTAERILSGKAQSIPLEPELDALGLRMQIVA